MAKKQIDYQKLSTELDSIISKLQAEETNLDEALELYERGVTITNHLQEYLKVAENKLHKIVEANEED